MASTFGFRSSGTNPVVPAESLYYYENKQYYFSGRVTGRFEPRSRPSIRWGYWKVASEDEDAMVLPGWFLAPSSEKAF